MMSGRGRGRGRGAAPSGPRPVARDDDGNVVNIEAKPEGAAPTGPPPLYPVRRRSIQSTPVCFSQHLLIYLIFPSFFRIKHFRDFQLKLN